MPSIFATFNTATKGLQAQNVAIQTTSNNISNADTEGYSRQRVNLVQSDPVTFSNIGQIGTGVDIDSIARIRNEDLDDQIRNQTSVNGTFTATQNIMDQVEMVFQEPSDTGLSTAMSDMWDAWETLSNSPEESSARTSVQQTAESLADTMNYMSEQLDTIKSDTVSVIETDTYNVNTLISDIADLSDEIYSAKLKSLEPNDLLDKRGVLLEDLSSKLGINIQTDDLGRIAIKEAQSGKFLFDNLNHAASIDYTVSTIRDVTQSGSTWTVTRINGEDTNDPETLTYTTDPGLSAGDVVLVDSSDSMTTLDLQEGEIAGYQKGLSLIDDYQSKLDSLAYGIAAAVNTIHSGNSTTGQYFFNDSSTTITAKNICVNDDILDDSSLINTRATTTSEAGDGSRALVIAQLRDVRLPVNDSSALSDWISNNYSSMSINNDSAGSTFDSFYNSVISQVGIDATDANDGVDNQSAILEQLETRRSSISGVAIDEEATNLVIYNSIYQANAQVIKTLTDMLDTLINGLGI